MMNRKKEAITAFHREQIMKAAAELFSRKGFEQTTIADISEKSDYSRRTIYAYFENKEDILNNIIVNGLNILKSDIEASIRENKPFLEQYQALCHSFERYRYNCPYSLNLISRTNTSELDLSSLSSSVSMIFSLGEQINALLSDFLLTGKEKGVILSDVEPTISMYILWGNINSLFDLVETKGVFIEKVFSISKKELLEYGYKQIINSILKERI